MCLYEQSSNKNLNGYPKLQIEYFSIDIEDNYKTKCPTI